MNDDVPWCIVCQSPHFADYCVVTQSFVSDHSTHNEEEDEKSHDDVSCNMVSMFDDCIDFDLDEHDDDVTSQRIAYQIHHQQIFSEDENYDKDKVCNISSNVENINLRMPSKEDIDKITGEMISEVHSNYSLRNQTIGNDITKTSGIFKKNITHEMEGDSKKTHIEIAKDKDNKAKKWEPKKRV